MNSTCLICGTLLFVDESICCICKRCKPVAAICCTSAEEGVKYGIPNASLDDLISARRYERKSGQRSTVLKALDRAIKKLQPIACAAP